MSFCRLILVFLCSFLPSTNAQTAIDLSGKVVVVLLNVTNVMPPHVIPHYEKDLETFFDTYFQESSSWPGEITAWNVRLDEQTELFVDAAAHKTKHHTTIRHRIRHHRNLGAQLVPLETRCYVTAQATQSLGNTNFESLLQTTIDTEQENLLNILKTSESKVVQVQFKYVNATQTFRPDEEVTTSRVVPDVEANAGSLKPQDVELGLNRDGLAGGEIAAIVICSLVVLCLFGSMYYMKMRKRHHERKEEEFFEQTMSSRAYGESLRYSMAASRAGGGGAGMSVAGSRSVGGGGSISMRSSATADRYRSQRLGSLRSSSTRVISPEGKTLSVRQGTSIRASGNFPLMKLSGGDAEKLRLYASSIATDEEDIYEDEEEQETTPHDQEEQESEVFENEGHYQDEPQPQPQQQQPQQQQQQQQYLQAEDNISYATDSQPDVASFYQSSVGSLNYEDATSRLVMAPPGRLGIVVETRLAGPVINRVNQDSPLLGHVFVGDLITAIDSVDCRAMSAASITSLMIRTSNETRRMIVKTPSVQH